MKIVKDNKRYKIHTGQRRYKDVLDVANVLTVDDIAFIAEATTYKNFKSNVTATLYMLDRKYPVNKVCSILADGIFTMKRRKELALSRKGSGFNSRLSRMISNYALAERLGIECHLKNKLLENENAENKAKLLGL